MIIDKDKLESIQVILAGTEKDVSLHFEGKKDSEEGYNITKDKIYEFGKTIDDDYSFFDEIYPLDFLDAIENKQLYAVIDINLNEIKHFGDWSHLTKYLGIHDLVTLGVKVPKIIAKRFNYFSTRDSTKSTVLRELILEYLQTQISDDSLSVLYDEDF